MTTEQAKPEGLTRSPEVRVHDWDPEGSELLRKSSFKILDTWMRDGVQMPRIKYPTVDVRRSVIDLDAQIGIEAVDVCMPVTGVGTPIFKQNAELASYTAQNHPQMEIYVLTRSKNEDVEATLRFADQAKTPVSVILFRGSSDLRLLAENWDEKEIIESMAKFTRVLTNGGLKVIAATEDTTRTRPPFLRDIVVATKTEGALGFCVSDTVGYADPVGIAKQIEWLKNIIGTSTPYEIHFHGHDDTRNALANTVAAIKAGASVGHVTWLGMGERDGNTSLEALLSDLSRRDIDTYNMLPLQQGAKLISEACSYPIPPNYPLVGANSFTHESGIHAAGVHNARKMGNPDIEGKVYSAVDPRKVGRKHESTIGPLSGVHNVHWELENRGIEPTPEIDAALLKAAKFKGGALNPEEIDNVLEVTINSNGNGHLVME